jgi:SAM-dependent methyltransferase
MPTETNDQSIWDQLWSDEGLDTWRTYPGPFGRICWLLQNVTRETQPESSEGPDTANIVDIGCGVGHLLSEVREAVKENQPEASYTGVDLSPVAIEKMVSERDFDIRGEVHDLEDHPPLPAGNILLCTETLEHLTMPAVEHILESSKTFAKCFFMVPNYCLGPEVEPQHMRQWSAKEFLDLLKRYHPTARVEVFYDDATFKKTGHRGYLLGVCGYEKPASMSFTMPVKDEAADIERVLASFRGAADEIVIGIDDKTEDDTEEIAKLYADKVFRFTWEKSFCKARNHCIERCTSDWIFMSEGHESLKVGLQVLLQLDEVPTWINVLEVRREARNNAWYFPWLFRNKRDKDGELVIKFARDVHNTVVGFKEKECAHAHQVATWHERSVDNAVARANQRRGMNKQSLLESIRAKKSVSDMYYLATEYRDLYCTTCKGQARVRDEENSNGQPAYKPCPDCIMYTPQNEPISMGTKPYGVRQAIFWFECFIRTCKPVPLRYQARVSLSGIYKRLKMYGDAKRVLAQGVIDDATRIEHWYLLGEICEELGQWDLAMRFFEYASLGIGRPPMSYVFLDKAMYTYLPAQKLVSAYAQLGLWDEALTWAKKVPTLMPEWAPQEAFDQAHGYIEQIEQRVTQGELQ